MPRGRDAHGAGGADAALFARESGGYLLDNGLLRVAVDGRGLIVSVVETATDREALAPGAAGNLLQIHRDLPNAWDASDVDSFYRRTQSDITAVESLAAADEGPERAAVAVTRRFGASTVRQVVALARGSGRGGRGVGDGFGDRGGTAGRRGRCGSQAVTVGGNGGAAGHRAASNTVRHTAG